MPPDSARKQELLEAAYAYVLQHGLSDVSLRPLAEAIGSSPRVLLFLFDSKDGLIRALLERARGDELSMLEARAPGGGLAEVARGLWEWFATPAHRPFLVLWLEGYSRSLQGEDGPWAGFGASTVESWLAILGREGASPKQSTAVLAILRGGLLDLLATGDEPRVTAAVRAQLESVTGA